MQSTPAKRKQIRIGTRSSALAQAQADQAIETLRACFPEGTILEKVLITTSGDTHLEDSLSEVGGKGLFTKEIEEALLRAEIDLAVHSMKDVETHLPEGLTIPAMLPREDVRDVLISRKGWTLEQLPQHSVIGTSSLRRAAMVRHHRPDVTIIPFRGNVLTRLKKLEDGVADATLLAMAGLNRLKLEVEGMSVFDPETFIPAVAQGAVGLQCRSDDDFVKERLSMRNDEETFACATAERAMLRVLDGSCRTPIAGYATLKGKAMTLRGMVLKPDGSHVESHYRQWDDIDPAAAGEEVGHRLLEKIGKDFF